MEVLIMKQLLEANDKLALQNRAYFQSRGLYVVNLMGGPGSGKTTLILALAKCLGLPVGVIEGDIASTIDAQTLQDAGVSAVQINTGGECHLDAQVVREGAEGLEIHSGVLFIENVGNLICPAEFDLGEDLRLLAASVPEGDDKPYKYVPMFSYADVVALTKADLKQAVGFDDARFRKGLRLVSQAPLFEVSCRKNEGVAGLAAFIREKYEGKK